jgi:hypothetical protein
MKNMQIRVYYLACGLVTWMSEPLGEPTAVKFCHECDANVTVMGCEDKIVTDLSESLKPPAPVSA